MPSPIDLTSVDESYCQPGSSPTQPQGCPLLALARHPPLCGHGMNLSLRHVADAPWGWFHRACICCVVCAITSISSLSVCRRSVCDATRSRLRAMNSSAAAWCKHMVPRCVMCPAFVCSKCVHCTTKSRPRCCS